MKRFGLIGCPLTGSGSPRLFADFAIGHGIEASYDLIERSSFEEAWTAFMDGYDAVNVTVPFKVPACRRADILSQECEKIGAANILVKTPGGVKAYNSDYLGVLALLKNLFPGLAPVEECDLAQSEYAIDAVTGIPSDGPEALIFGCGGAGKAAAVAALDAGFAHVTLANRTLSTAAQLSFSLAPWYNGRLRLTSPDQIGEQHYDLAVYAVPTPTPQIDLLDASFVLEANYRTPCLSAHPGYIAGQRWLEAQASEGYPLMIAGR